MSSMQPEELVGAIVARRPELCRVFEKLEIDYCCGGKRSLAEVCQDKGWIPEVLIAQLEDTADALREGPVVDAASMSLIELADHIENTHHTYLRNELPRLDTLTDKVAAVHGHEDSRLNELRIMFRHFAKDLSAHMQKEERILFPLIRQLDRDPSSLECLCGTIANPIQQIEKEHHDAGDALAAFRTLTDGFTPPDGACNTYRAMLAAFAELERDMHQHIHKEDNVLFPTALKRQNQKAAFVIQT